MDCWDVPGTLREHQSPSCHYNGSRQDHKARWICIVVIHRRVVWICISEPQPPAGAPTPDIFGENTVGSSEHSPTWDGTRWLSLHRSSSAFAVRRTFSASIPDYRDSCSLSLASHSPSAGENIASECYSKRFVQASKTFHRNVREVAFLHSKRTMTSAKTQEWNSFKIPLKSLHSKHG